MPPRTGRAAGLAGWGWDSPPGWEGAAREERGSAAEGREGAGWAAAAAHAAAVQGAAAVCAAEGTEAAGAAAAEAATGMAAAGLQPRCLHIITRGVTNPDSTHSCVCVHDSSRCDLRAAYLSWQQLVVMYRLRTGSDSACMDVMDPMRRHEYAQATVADRGRCLELKRTTVVADSSQDRTTGSEITSARRNVDLHIHAAVPAAAKQTSLHLVQST